MNIAFTFISSAGIIIVGIFRRFAIGSTFAATADIAEFRNALYHVQAISINQYWILLIAACI